MKAVALALLWATAAWLGARSSFAQVDPGADAWLIMNDISPFAVGTTAKVSAGASGIMERYFGEDPQDLFAGTDYSDDARDMTIEVAVIRVQRTTYLDHLLEAKFRDGRSGRMHAENSVISVGGESVLFSCAKPPPQCEDRTYSWRSGSNILVTIRAHAMEFFTDAEGLPKPRPIPCPAPTEILQAYLQRYPSALVPYSESDDRAKTWLRQQVALSLEAAESHLDREVSAVDPIDKERLLEDAVEHLLAFLRLRASALAGPAADRELRRLSSLDPLPLETQARKLAEIRQEYRAWWNVHQNDAVQLATP